MISVVFTGIPPFFESFAFELLVFWSSVVSLLFLSFSSFGLLSWVFCFWAFSLWVFCLLVFRLWVSYLWVAFAYSLAALICVRADSAQFCCLDISFNSESKSFPFMDVSFLIYSFPNPLDYCNSPPWHLQTITIVCICQSIISKILHTAPSL